MPAERTPGSVEQAIFHAPDGTSASGPFVLPRTQTQAEIARIAGEAAMRQVARHDEVLESEAFSGQNGLIETLLSKLPPLESLWMPEKYLPKNEDEARELIRQAAANSDASVAAEVGHEVTEVRIQLYTGALNRYKSLGDKTGSPGVKHIDQRPLPRWLRRWGGEEERHGFVLHDYLYFDKRVDRRSLELTNLTSIAAGFTEGIDYYDSYQALIWTSFQEFATLIAHGNQAVLSELEGNKGLGKINRALAGEEGRHGRFYSAIVKALFDHDPNGAMIAFRNVMKNRVVMPGAQMYDDGSIIVGAETSPLFDKYALVNERLRIYDGSDYANLLGYFIEEWDIENRQVSGEAEKARDELMRMRDLYKKRADRKLHASWENAPDLEFKWLPGKIISLKNPGLILPDNKRMMYSTFQRLIKTP